MDNFGSLLCGGENTGGIAKDALDHLGRSLNNFFGRASRYLREEASDDSVSLGPFCARVVLENSCAALLGRLDPFRMLYLCEFQATPEYESGKRAKSSFSWVGDVIPLEERPNHVLWSIDNDLSKISRALMSRYLNHVYWAPAVDRMLDFVSTNSSDPRLADILAFEAGTYIQHCKGKSAQLYSALSKGVHWEFFTTALMFDDATVKTLIRDTLLLVGHLGLTSHFIPTAYAAHTPEKALELYLSFRDDVQ
jgi:hypothetical protein